jgi:hypothetical protein
MEGGGRCQVGKGVGETYCKRVILPLNIAGNTKTPKFSVCSYFLIEKSPKAQHFFEQIF